MARRPYQDYDLQDFDLDDQAQTALDEARALPACRAAAMVLRATAAHRPACWGVAKW